MKNLIIIILILFFFPGCALQKDLRALDKRLTIAETQVKISKERHDTYIAQNSKAMKKNQGRIIAEVNALKKIREKENQKLRNKYAGQSAGLEQIREDLQLINGRLEEIEYLFKRRLDSFEEKEKNRGSRLDQLAEDIRQIKKRSNRLEKYLNLEYSATAANVLKDASIADDPKQINKLTEKQLYLSAKKAFDSTDFAKALAMFEEFLKKYPKSKNADNSQFWIGEIYYHDKWYEKAILEYQKVIEKYPRGNKVPAALLKQGLAFFRLGDKANTRLILKELIKKFPKVNEAKIAGKKLKNL